MTTVKGTAKVDKFTVNAGNVIVVTGKKSKKPVISKSGKNKIYGDAGKDKFTVLPDTNIQVEFDNHAKIDYNIVNIS